MLDELDLVAQRDTPIRDLSGGERRRTACGMELVGNPDVLLLDEPTSGLDPVLERRLMLMFRRLADQGRAVVVATHATGSLGVCDAVARPARPTARSAFSGAPAEARAHLEADRPCGRDAASPSSMTAGAADGAARPVAERSIVRRRRFGLELRTLTARYVRTLTARSPHARRAARAGADHRPADRDPVRLRPADRVRPPPRPISRRSVFLLHDRLGLARGHRRATRDRQGAGHHRAGVRRRSAARRLRAGQGRVLFVLSAAQVLLMVAVVIALRLQAASARRRSSSCSGSASRVAWTSVALGLLVSAAARSVDQATGVIPLMLIPQLLFAGALIPLGRMPRAVEALAAAHATRGGRSPEWARRPGLQAKFTASSRRGERARVRSRASSASPRARAPRSSPGSRCFWLFVHRGAAQPPGAPRGRLAGRGSLSGASSATACCGADAASGG